MEDNQNRKYINISKRPYTPAVYNEKDNNDYFSYKPASGFWLSLEAKEKGYYSEWDMEFRETLQADDDGNLHATIVKLKPTTYTLSPDADRTLLEGFNSFVSSKKLSIEQKRKLLVELVRSHTNREDIENVICQIDLIEDIRALEEIFGGYKFGNSYPDEVYENLASNVKKGIRESFSGLEVTAYALGMDEEFPYNSVIEAQTYMSMVDPKYKETIDYFDMPSAVIFDTSCLDIIQEIVYPQEIRSLEGEDREDY